MNVWIFGAVLTISISILIAFITFVFKHGVWKGEVDSDRSNFREFMNEIRRDIKEIRDRLTGGIPPAVEPGSPLQLTEYGEKLAKSLDAEQWAEKESAGLLPKVQGKDAYEVQELCSAYVFDELKPTEAQERTMRKCMYEHGATRTHVNEVLSLVLRNRLLRELGFNVSCSLKTSPEEPL